MREHYFRRTIFLTHLKAIHIFDEPHFVLAFPLLCSMAQYATRILDFRIRVHHSRHCRSSFQLFKTCRRPKNIAAIQDTAQQQGALETIIQSRVSDVFRSTNSIHHCSFNGHVTQVLSIVLCATLSRISSSVSFNRDKVFASHHGSSVIFFILGFILTNSTSFRLSNVNNASLICFLNILQ